MFNVVTTAELAAIPEQELEELRRTLGVSKTVLQEMLQHASPDSLREAHARFVEHTKAAIEREFKAPSFRIDGKSYVSAIQAARALGTGEFHLSNLRDRGKLNGTPHGRRVVYAKSDLLALLKQSKDSNYRSPLASSFARWLEIANI
jgi:hypothetical protein